MWTRVVVKVYCFHTLFFIFAFLLLTSDDKDINNDYDNLIE